MVHTAAAKGNAALTKRQRRKTSRNQYDTADSQVAVSSDSYPVGQLEPHNAQQIASHRLGSDSAGQCLPIVAQQQPGHAPVVEHSLVPCSPLSLPDTILAATPVVQTLALQPTLRLAAPSTGWLSDSVKVADRVASLLNSFDALQVSQELQKLGYPELVGQRACLEVHLVKQHVDLDSCVNWINQQANLASLNRSLNPLELIKYQDLAQAVAKLLERVPGINQQTAQIAIQQTLGDIDAAAAFLNAAMNKSHLPNSGDPNVMASLLLQNLPPGFSLPANSGEVVQAMAAAMAKANELQLATDRLAAAAIQSQQQIKAAMVAGQLPAANGHDPTQQQQSQQPQELLAQMVPQQPSSIAAEWQKEKQEIMVTVEVLEKHKDWADKKIGQLIKRVTEAERPQKDEAYRLRDEVHKLRQEKDVLESKLKEFERSLQKLKDCTYQEATQKREYERRVQSVQADLRGANLREQELQGQVEQEVVTVRTERKKRETAEKLCKKAVEDKASLLSSLADAEKQIAQAQAAARRQERLAEDRASRAEDQAAASTQARQDLDSKCELLTVEKASMASALEDKDAQIGRMQQDQTSLQAQVLQCQQQVAELQADLLQSHQALTAKEQQTSFYSHWTGGGGGICGRLDDVLPTPDTSRSPTSTSPPTPLAAHPHPPASLTSAQNGHRSPDQTSPSVCSPIGPRVTHRKSSSFDIGKAPAPAMFSSCAPQQPQQQHAQQQQHHAQQQQQQHAQQPQNHIQQRPQHQQQQQQQQADMSGHGLNLNIRSPKPQHALPAGPGAMSSLLGLPYSSSGSEASNGVKGLKTSKSLQQRSNGRTYGNRPSENGVASLLSSASYRGSFNAASPSWNQQSQQAYPAQPGNGFSYSDGQDLAQHSDAFLRQLHIL